MSLELIILILIAHFVGDFALQTTWQATNKSKNFGALAVHVGTYTLTLTPLLFFLPLQWVLLNGFLHIVTDFWTSRASAYFWAKKDSHNFFVVVGFDQMIHYMTLFITAGAMI